MIIVLRLLMNIVDSILSCLLQVSIEYSSFSANFTKEIK